MEIVNWSPVEVECELHSSLELQQVPEQLELEAEMDVGHPMQADEESAVGDSVPEGAWRDEEVAEAVLEEQELALLTLLAPLALLAAAVAVEVEELVPLASWAVGWAGMWVVHSNPSGRPFGGLGEGALAPGPAPALALSSPPHTHTPPPPPPPPPPQHLRNILVTFEECLSNISVTFE